MRIEERTAELAALHRQVFGTEKTNGQANGANGAHDPGAVFDAHHLIVGRMSDDVIVATIRRSKQADKFNRLYSGDISGYPSSSEAEAALCAILAFYTRDADQIDRIVQASKLSRDKWTSKRGNTTYGAHTIAGAIALVTERYSGARPDADDQDAPKSYHQTDLGNARRLIDRHGHQIRHVTELDQWHVWDGTRWGADEKAIRRLATETVAVLWHEAIALTDKAERDKALKFAARSESAGSIEAMVRLATNDLAVSVSVSDLDTDMWLFNCLNGTIDLRTGELRTHNPADLITKIAPINYIPGAQLELWEQFLARLGTPEVVAYLQCFGGYCLTGSTREDRLTFMYGPGGSGKTTFGEAIHATMGDYAMKASFDTFIARRDAGAPRPDIARLRGARAVFAVEVNKGRKLDAALLKEATGGDTVTARFLFGREFEFPPQFKLTLIANDRPEVPDDDTGMWRRLTVVETTEIPEGERDKTIKERLKDPAIAGEAILAWLVEGCLTWQREKDLKIPQAVRQATNAYRDAMDPLSDFIDERCELGPKLSVVAGELRRAYDIWADENGVDKKHRPNTRNWGQRWKAKGCTPAQRHGIRWWLGVRLQVGGTEQATLEGDSGTGIGSWVPESGQIPEGSARNASRTDLPEKGPIPVPDGAFRYPVAETPPSVAASAATGRSRHDRTMYQEGLAAGLSRDERVGVDVPTPESSPTDNDGDEQEEYVV